MIEDAIYRAFKSAKNKNWNVIYFAIDLHETCLVANYGKGSYKWISNTAREVLKKISDRKDCKIILWSSVYADEESDIIKFFNEAGINVLAFNNNPEVKNTASGNFDTKFYFNILIDDKAGFNWQEDWDRISEYLKFYPKEL